jgi:hypothetical protein
MNGDVCPAAALSTLSLKKSSAHLPRFRRFDCRRGGSAHQAIKHAKHRNPACSTGKSWLNFTDLSRRQFTGSLATRSLQPLTRLSFPWYARSLYSRETTAR